LYLYRNSVRRALAGRNLGILLFSPGEGGNPACPYRPSTPGFPSFSPRGLVPKIRMVASKK
jgi:hypothetical protein